MQNGVGAIVLAAFADELGDSGRTQVTSSDSERHLRAIVDGLPVVVTLMTPDGELAHANRSMLDFFGMTLTEMQSLPLEHFFHPDDRAAVLSQWRHSLETGDPFDLETRQRRADGAYRTFHSQGIPLRDEAGNIVLWYFLQTNIDDRKRAEAILSGEKQLLEMVARQDSMRDVLEALCLFVEEMVEGCYCSVVLVDPSGERLGHGAAPSLPASFIQAIIGRPVNRDSGPCAMAAYLDEPISAADLETETRWADYQWCPMALAHGLRACVSTPIPARSGKPLGALAVYFDEPGAQDSLDRGIIEQFTHVASIAIERARNDAVLRQRDALLAGEKRMLEMVATGRPLTAVLEELSLLFEALSGDCRCGVWLVDESDTCLRLGAAPNVPAGYCEAIDGWPIGMEAGPCAMAIHLNEQVLSPDVDAETRWQSFNWPNLALSYDMRAVWSTPIRSRKGQVLGSFAVCFNRPATPTQSHLGLIEQFTHIASIAIEQMRSREALARSEALLAEAQRLSSTGSFSWRVDGDVVVYSEQTYRTYEFDPGAPVTLDMIATRIHPEDIPLLEEMIAIARGTGADLNHEYRLQMPDGTVKHMHLVARGSRDANGELEYIGAIQDVTQRTLAGEALGKVRSELAHVARVSSLGTLTASIAHEVNQPLAGIVTNAGTCLRMLAGDHPNVAGAIETARRTMRDANRASAVITRLRALFGKKEVAAEAVDLNEAAREVIALVGGDLQRNKVLLRTELAEDLSLVMGDRIQLQQVILNLLLNGSGAMRAVTDRPRRLTIRTSREGDAHARLCVEDEGIGFDPRDTGRMFEAFHTTKADGMGIGLAVSRSIVESHGGEISAAVNDGPGATFAFTIPFGPEPVKATVSACPGNSPK